MYFQAVCYYLNRIRNCHGKSSLIKGYKILCFEMVTLIILCVLLHEWMPCNGVRSPSIMPNKSDA